MFHIRNRNGWTASQQAGDEAVEAIAIALGETLPKTHILNQAMDPCLRIYGVGLDWPDKAEIVIHLTKRLNNDGWTAIEGILRQTTQSCIVEIFFDFHDVRSRRNPSLTMPTATLVKDQTRNCLGALDLNEHVCDCEMCQFARNRREKLCKLLASLTAKERALRQRYGSPGHM